MLYLITASEHYYPEPGTRDWVGITSNPSEALRLYTDAVISGRGTTDVFIVGIDPAAESFTELRIDDVAEAANAT